VLDARRNPGPRAEEIARAGVAHLDLIDYQNQRLKLTTACRQCHGLPFVREQLDLRDKLLRESDRLTAEAVREVAALQAEQLVPERAGAAFPDLVAAAAGTPVERRLAKMFFDHRAKLLATAFHMSPDVVRWRTLLARDLAEIRELAAGLRAEKARTAPRAKKKA
jgi:hypothetical protein